MKNKGSTITEGTSSNISLLARLWFFATIIALLAIPGIAASSNDRPMPMDLTEMSIEDLMSIEVTTVSRKAQRLSDSAAAVFVITQEDIRRSGATSIPEVLRMAPGLQVARMDANKWAVTSRGFNGYFANKLLVLMDGRSVYTPLFSGVFWDVQDTLIEDVARIEVIRGPGAALWGANAVNGVINIITKPANETQGGLFTGGLGTEEKGFGGIRYGGKVGDSAHYRAYAKYFKRDSSVDAHGDDAYDEWHVSRGGGRIDWKTSGHDALTLQGDYYDGEAKSIYTYPAFEPPYARTVDDESAISGGNILGRWQRTFSESSDLSLQVYYDRTKRSFFVLSDTQDIFDLDFQHQFGLGETHDFMWGVGYRFTRGEIRNTDTMSYDPATRDDHLFSLFLQDEISLIPDKFSLLLGSKFEENDYTGFEIQPNLRLLWTPLPEHSVWAAISRAVRTPSQAEHDMTMYLTAPIPSTVLVYLGDHEFDSEELIAYEAGYRLHPNERFSLDLSLFYNRYHDLRTIEPGRDEFEVAPPPLLIPFVLDNKMKGNTYGAELALDWRPLGWWRLQGAYTFFEIQLDLDSPSGDYLTEPVLEGTPPEHQFSLRSSMDLPMKTELDLWFRYVDNLPYLDIKSTYTMDMRLGWNPTKNLEISIVGQNLYETHHPEYIAELMDAFPEEVERSVYGKLTWRF